MFKFYKFVVYAFSLNFRVLLDHKLYLLWEVIHRKNCKIFKIINLVIAWMYTLTFPYSSNWHHKKNREITPNLTIPVNTIRKSKDIGFHNTRTTLLPNIHRPPIGLLL